MAVPLGGTGSGGRSLSGGRGIWLDGEVLACSCPECGAPMSIRLWLMVADCFRCGASLELDEEQEQEALRLMREQEAAKRADSQAAVAAISPTVARQPKPQRPPSQPAQSQPAQLPAESETKRPSGEVSSTATAVAATVPATAPATAPSRSRRVAASDVRRGTRAHIRDIYEKGGVAVFWSQMFKDLPAWLISMVIHMVAMLLLAMWVTPVDEEVPDITLATSVSNMDLEGDIGDLDDLTPEEFDFEDPGAIEFASEVEELGTNDSEPEIEPIQSTLPPAPPIGNLPGQETTRRAEIPSAAMGRMFAGRDPQARAQAVQTSGGTSATEAAVARGLLFLARHQHPDGHWSLNTYHNTSDCDATCRAGIGRSRSDVAATSLALLPFLGAAQTHRDGDYTKEVYRGLKWLLDQQKEDGDLRGQGDGQMYAHGQAAIALCEAYALTGDEQLREPAQLALNFIIKAQHSGGGWRYTPGQAGDTSVVGWQLMALKSGQMAYLYVPSKTFRKAALFLDHVQADKVGGRYGYQRGGSTPTMTAEALLCRQYLGWPKDHPGLRAGARYLLDEHSPKASRPNIYYWYYATQMMHHLGGDRWDRWNARMRDVMVQMQETKGHAAGSWSPSGRGTDGGFADRGGRIYMTALAICTLEVYYRHMPIYSSEALLPFE
ncbi:MAG: terpene cyclase/mutase family protein [Candidatus Nealsonbacteria bacterium]|nr:terpene cyclase/mutase family protein [Candidatus Nealsonbacteria bacterium]